MLKTLIGNAGRNQALQLLIELVEALEQRVPRPHPVGDAQIVAEAARLQARANKSIQENQRRSVTRESADTRRAQAAMTDDGAPVRTCPEGEEAV
jgi:hypothetical protein